MTGVLARDAVHTAHHYRYVVDGVPIGEAQIHRPRGTGRAEIWAVEIAREHRGQGHGRGLMRALLHELDCWGIDDVSLWVEADNWTAIRLYASLGFERVDVSERGVLMRRTP